MPWHIITGKWKETKRVFLEGRNVFFSDDIFRVVQHLLEKREHYPGARTPKEQTRDYTPHKQTEHDNRKEKYVQGRFFKPAVPFPNLFRLPPSPPPFCSRGETNGREC